MERDVALAYYAGGPDLTEVVLSALRDAGRPVDPIDPDDLAGLDEFHGLGRAATVAMARLAAIAPGERVLDVGAGIGGPARTLTRHFGAQVTAVDPTARFCELNRELNRRAGLDDRIEVVDGDGRALPFDDGSFDVAWTQAVWQSVDDKRALLSELRRVLRTDGRVAAFEVVAGPNHADGLHMPVPWATVPGESFVDDPAELRELAEAVGFEVREWRRGDESVQTIGAVAAGGGPELAQGVDGVTLAVVMPDFDERMAGLARNVMDQRIQMLMAVLAAT
jgi:SAM-dependent methyltransferase